MKSNLPTHDKKTPSGGKNCNFFSLSLQMNQNEATYKRPLSGDHTDLWLLQLPDTNGEDDY